MSFLYKHFNHVDKTECPDRQAALEIRAGQRSITANRWPLTAHIYHVMIIVTGGFSKKSFYYYYLFRRNSFEQS